MKTSFPWKCLASVLGLASAGCGMLYVQHGYYESWGLPGWAYSLADGACTFTHTSRPEVPIQVTLHGQQGQVSFGFTAELPEGVPFQYAAPSAQVTTEGRRLEAPVTVSVKEPQPAETRQHYGLSEREVAPRERAVGRTLHIPRAFVFRQVHTVIAFSGSFPLEEGQEFTLELPAIAYGNEVLPAFKARFHWNDGAVHLLKHVS